MAGQEAMQAICQNRSRNEGEPIAENPKGVRLF
jgi:hypothetical protein